MIVPKELVIESKKTFGQEAAIFIAAKLNIEKWDENNLRGSCPFGHIDDTPSFIWNPKNSSFHCFSCGRNFDIIDYFMSNEKLTYLGAVQKLFEKVGIKFSFGEKGIRTERDYRYPHHSENPDRSFVESYWEGRKISKETLDYADVQQDEHGNTAFHYYDTNDVLTMVKYRKSRKVAKGEDKNFCQKDADTAPLLYNMNRIDFTNGPLLICEGEGDTLSAIEAGYKNAVSVPFGSNTFTWIEKNFEWLELFNKIVVWSDSDKAGQDMRKEVCSRLGIWRTLYVDPPTTAINENGETLIIKDINEVLYYYGKQKVLDLINEAKELPIQDVSELSSIDDFDIESAQGLFPGLKVVEDTVYKFLFSSVILVTGQRGSGKSTLINQMFVCEPLNQGHDVFLFSGELGGPVVKSWIELSMAGPEKIKMKNTFVHVVDPQAKLEMRSWYKNRIWIYNGSGNKSEDILDRAIATTRKYGTKVWILDNLLTLDIGATDRDLLQKQKDFIVKLNQLALLYGVLIVLIAHPRKVMTGMELGSDDIEGTGAFGNLAQYILSVRRFSDKEKAGEKDSRGGYRIGKEPISEDCEINVMKNRYTGKVKKCRCYFNYASYRFYNTREELYKRLKWNKDTSPLPTSLPEVDKNIPEMIRTN